MNVKFLIDLIHQHSYSRALKLYLRETEIFLIVILKSMGWSCYKIRFVFNGSAVLMQ